MEEIPFSPSGRMKLKMFLRRAVAFGFSVSGLAALWNGLVARRGVRILAYHGVESPPQSPFSVSVDNFDSQMKYLKEKCNVITLTEFLDFRKDGHQWPDHSVVVTFDDGFFNVYENAFDILNKYGLPAECFVIAAKLNEKDRAFMGRDEVTSLSKSPLITIGSHSLTHRSIERVADQKERAAEVVQSKSDIERVLGSDIDHFCYPYGTYKDFGPKSVDAIQQAGYLAACTSVNGINFAETDPYRLRRTKIEWGDDPKTFRRIMNGALDAWWLVDYFLTFLQRPRIL